MLDLSHPSLHLRLLPSQAFIARFPAGTQLPPALLADPEHAGSFLTVSKTPAEVSVIWDAPSVAGLLPFRPTGHGAGTVGPDGPWRVLMVAGPFEFSVVGVMARLSADLAAKSVSLMAVSTCASSWSSCLLSGGRSVGGRMS